MRADLPTLLERVASVESLNRSLNLCMRGKRGNHGACAFSLNRGSQLVRLSAELLSGRFQFSGYRVFRVKDPKEREIAAAPIVDRVVHRALFDVLEPLCEPHFDPSTFACRVGKGTSGAVTHAWQVIRVLGSERFVMKLDVSRYFESLPHLPLIESLKPVLLDDSLITGPGKLLLQLVESFGTGKGIPLGNLTSQLFANWYLTPIDSLLRKHEDEVQFVRYMDDVLIMSRSKPVVLDVTDRVVESASALGLAIPIRKRMPIGAGPVPFLGFVLTESGYRPLQRSRQRFRKHLCALARHELGQESSSGVVQRSSKERAAVQSRLAWIQMPAHQRCLAQGVEDSAGTSGAVGLSPTP